MEVEEHKEKQEWSDETHKFSQFDLDNFYPAGGAATIDRTGTMRNIQRLQEDFKYLADVE